LVDFYCAPRLHGPRSDSCGLVCLRIAERERERSGRPAVSRAEKPESRWEPPSIVQGIHRLSFAERRGSRETDPDDNTEPRAYDEQSWRLLLSADEDIRRLTTILAQYGQSYVDEFAAAYLALNDKQHLPMIVEQLVASAMRNRRAGTIPPTKAMTRASLEGMLAKRREAIGFGQSWAKPTGKR
jgi:hypothetical protein